MENQKIPKTSNFWSGFISGAGVGVAISFLFGTKKGRQFLKNLLELSENFEENLAALLADLEKNLAEKREEIVNEIKKTPAKKESPNLQYLINKIKNRLTF